MRFTATTGPLASALGLAATLTTDRFTKRIPVLGAVRLTAADGTVTVSTNNLDAAISLTVPADVADAGEIAVNTDKLAGLTANFPKDATVEVASEDPIAIVKSGRSRFKLPTFPLDDLPILTLTGETGRATIARDDAVEAFSRTAFAICSEPTRAYLTGVLLHGFNGGLAAVATDGHRLVRAVVAGGGTLSADRTCIVPAPTVSVIDKLLARHRDVGAVVLRRSATLFEIEGGPFRLTSKLIDGCYPDYERVIPGFSGNVVVVDRAALTDGLARIAAVGGDKTIAEFSWPEGDEGGLRLGVDGHGDAARDIIITKSTIGAARIAFKAAHGLEPLAAFDTDTVAIDAGNAVGVPVLVTGEGSISFVAMQMQGWVILILLGCDPGISGALAVIEVIDGVPMLLDVIDMPITGTGAKTRVDVIGAATWVSKHAPSTAV
jgi:DNA polymerase III subunit beta